MTEKQTIKWIADELRTMISQAIQEAKQKNPNLLYTTDWLIGMTYREVGFLLQRYIGRVPPKDIWPIVKGDYSQRKGEKEASYHGFGLMQIDIGSFPDFVKSGDWKDPLKTYKKAISVLESKRQYLQKECPSLSGDELCRAITAGYNAGAGRLPPLIEKGADIDTYTHQHNYSKEVWRFREIYNSLLREG